MSARRWLFLLVLAAGCGSAVPPPAALTLNQDACGYCRMIVSDGRFASQIAARLEEPGFFDDLGCLANHLRNTASLSDGAIVYVADHRTREWIVADRAIYTRVERFTAPMGSHIIAHASEASRAADADAAGGSPVELKDVLPVEKLRGPR